MDMAVGVLYSFFDYELPKSLPEELGDDSRSVFITPRPRGWRPLFVVYSRRFSVLSESDQLSRSGLFS